MAASGDGTQCSSALGPRADALAPVIERLARDLIAAPEDEAGHIKTLRRGAPLFADPSRFAEDMLSGTARLIGRYWIEDEADFVAVTMATHQLSMLLLRLEEDPASFGFASGETAIALAQDEVVALMVAPGERHGFGLSLLAYRLRQAGWRVHIAEAARELAQFVEAVRPLVVGISIGLPGSIAEAERVVFDLRKRCGNTPPYIAFGGPAFLDPDAGCTRVRPDLVATSADEMLDWLGRIESSPRDPPMAGGD